MSACDPHLGSSVDDFLAEEGFREEANIHAVTRVLAWQISESMKTQGISKVVLDALALSLDPLKDVRTDKHSGVK